MSADDTLRRAEGSDEFLIHLSWVFLLDDEQHKNNAPSRVQGRISCRQLFSIYPFCLSNNESKTSNWKTDKRTDSLFLSALVDRDWCRQLRFVWQFHPLASLKNTHAHARPWSKSNRENLSYCKGLAYKVEQWIRSIMFSMEKERTPVLPSSYSKTWRILLASDVVWCSLPRSACDDSARSVLWLDHNQPRNDHGCYVCASGPDDRTHTAASRMMRRSCRVWLYWTRNSCRTSSTESGSKECMLFRRLSLSLTLTILAFFDVLYCSITCLILSQFSTCHNRISQSYSREKLRTWPLPCSLTFDTETIHLLSLEIQTSLIQSRCPYVNERDIQLARRDRHSSYS